VLRPVIAMSSRRLPRFDSLLALGAVLALLIGIVLFFAKFPATTVGGATGSPPATSAAGSIGVLQVTGLKLDEAIRALQGAGFNVRWDVASGQGAACSVVSQDPAAGSAAARGSYVSLRYITGKDCTKKND